MRHLHLIGVVDGESVAPLIEALQEAAESNVPAVTLLIDSPGGSVYPGLSLIIAMRQAQRAGVQVTCIADGMAASMAAIILESCDFRIATRRTAILFHGVSTSGCEGKSEDLQKCTNEVVDLTKWLTIIAAGRLNIGFQELERRMAARDYWVGWEEALEIGAIDAVVP
jgi:ATP-dependent protease ClpP protease subunit